VLVDESNHAMEIIVPDDQLSLAIGREGQNARLAAKLTGWKVDIKSETEFSQEEEELTYEEGEDVDGRCAAVLSAGRRCPNASLQGSRYCGLPQHQALARFDTNQVTVLSGLSDEEISVLADPNADDAQVRPLVERATAAFEQQQGEEEAAEEPSEAEADLEEAEEQAEADVPEGEQELQEAEGEAAESVEAEDAEEKLEPEQALAEDAATEGEEPSAEAATVGANPSEEPKATGEDSEGSRSEGA
jgi:N utilization substance protein A